MVLQVLADPGLVQHGRNRKVAQLLARTHTGKQQKLRRAERAGRQDHFAAAAGAATSAVLAPAHADGTLAGKLDALDQTTGLEPQVRPIEHRLEEAARGRPAPPEFLVDVEIARALVVAGVEIVDRLDAGLGGGLAKLLEQVPAHARRFDAPFAADRVMRTRSQKMMFVLLEDRQHVAPAPAGEPELAPMIVVRGLPAHVDHGIDRRRAADHLAARIGEAAAVEPLVRLGAEHPVGARIADREQIADRDVEPDPVVPPASLEQQHALAWIG